MILFDLRKLSFNFVYLKTVTTAGGGSINILDEKKTTSKKEVLQHIKVPLAIARAFIKRYQKITKYLKPVPTLLVMYDNHVISMERHPLGAFGTMEEQVGGVVRHWRPDSQINFDNIIKPILDQESNRPWMFDGRYVYRYNDENIEDVIKNGVALDESGKFRAITVTTVDMQQMYQKTALNVKRVCIAFVSSIDKFSISPPIWKSIEGMGHDKNPDAEDGDVNITGNQTASKKFDAIDQCKAVNLNFALAAGQQIGHLYGYEYVEPLRLPKMMIELQTTNLPNVSKEVKATHDIGMKFSHAFAWLLGLQRRANDLDTLIVMRSLLKYLTTKGIFDRSVFDPTTIFHDQKAFADVALMDLKELREKYDNDTNIVDLSSLIV